jgi:hypothetical protein
MSTGKKTASLALVGLFLLLGEIGQAQETTASSAELQNTTQQRSTDASACVDLSINGIYSGVIDSRQIALEIGAVSENRYIEDETRLLNGSLAPNQTAYPFEGRYFDRDKGVALLVEARRLPDGSVRVREYKSHLPTGDEWRLRFTGDHAEGFFCQCDVSQEDETSKPHSPISLKRVSKGFDPNFDWEYNFGHLVNQEYYDLLLDFPIKNGPEVRVNRRIAYIVQTDPRFDVKMPHITRFPNKAIMEEVNAELQIRLKYRRLWAANCAEADFHLPGGVGETLHVVLTRNILRMRRESAYICGWPAPKSDVETVTFNMRTGKNLGCN